jgi:PRTRC genetic system protein A
MFKVFINDGSKIPDADDLFYIIGKGGVFMRKKLNLVDCLVPVKAISFLKPVEPFINLNIPKIPEKIISTTAAFFKSVYNEYKSEAVVLLYLNRKTQQFSIYIPPQKVTAASLKYTRNASFSDRTYVGSIHSHASMSAFHSGTDTADEETSSDGIHITFGDLDSNNFEYSVSACKACNGFRIKVTPEEYMDGIVKLDDSAEEEVTGWVGNVYHYSSAWKNKEKYKFKEGSFPERWMKYVIGTKYEIKTYTYSSYEKKDESAYDKWWDSRFGVGCHNAYSQNRYGGCSGLDDAELLKQETEREQARVASSRAATFDPCGNCAFKDIKDENASDTL